MFSVLMDSTSNPNSTPGVIRGRDRPLQSAHGAQRHR
jgi:hypothetical protein